jgi:hypothetical protein
VPISRIERDQLPRLEEIDDRRRFFGTTAPTAGDQKHERDEEHAAAQPLPGATR